MNCRKFLLPFLAAPLIAYAQNVDRILPNAGDKAYCSARVEYPAGRQISAEIEAMRGNDGILQIEIRKSHETYKAPAPEKAFEYGSQFALLRVNGPAFGDDYQDSIMVGGKYADWGVKENRLSLSPAQSNLAKSALGCIAARKSTF